MTVLSFKRLLSEYSRESKVMWTSGLLCYRTEWWRVWSFSTPSVTTSGSRTPPSSSSSTRRICSKRRSRSLRLLSASLSTQVRVLASTSRRARPRSDSRHLPRFTKSLAGGLGSSRDTVGHLHTTAAYVYYWDWVCVRVFPRCSSFLHQWNWISSSFQHLDMTLAVAEASHKPNQNHLQFTWSTLNEPCISYLKSRRDHYV